MVAIKAARNNKPKEMPILIELSIPASRRLVIKSIAHINHL
jgi:hypothetical protein